MKTISRRTFVVSGATLPVASALGAGTAEFGLLGVGRGQGFAAAGTAVNFTGDGQSLSPQEYAQVLASILAEGEIQPDYYSLGGAVSELEGIEAEIHREAGVEFLYRDFRPRVMDGVRESKEMGVYRQQYCGCIYSERERYDNGGSARRPSGRGDAGGTKRPRGAAGGGGST